MEERQEVQISGLSRLVLPADRALFLWICRPTVIHSRGFKFLLLFYVAVPQVIPSWMKVRKCEGPYRQWALQIGLPVCLYLFSVPQPLTDWTDAESWFT